MDIKGLGRTVTLSGVILYTLNVILSITLYTLLTIVSLPVANINLRALLTAVPLISGVFNGLILAMLVMSLKYAEYYGLGRSALAIAIYLGYYFAFRPPMDIASLMFAIMALCVLQIIVLYFYAKVQKEMFG